MRCSSGMHWHFLCSFPKENNIKPSPANLLVNKMVLWTLVGSLRSCPCSAPIKVFGQCHSCAYLARTFFSLSHSPPPIIFPNLSRALTPISLRFLKSNSCRQELLIQSVLLHRDLQVAPHKLLTRTTQIILCLE